MAMAGEPRLGPTARPLSRGAGGLLQGPRVSDPHVQSRSGPRLITFTFLICKMGTSLQELLPKDKSFISSRIVCKDQHRQAGAAVKRNRAGTSLGEGAALTRHTVSTLGLPILGLREQKDLLRRIRSYRAPRKLQANSPE
ncbi:unnamed protein product [Rangifer tarandus platyrhynchus]|uniref:Uncharacterized protein n=1 Tax=Rangifer tarandus platyrhynchus TaxID=3082113 RepID=A0AC59YFQ8_RANTA